ncbi:hypothetical protein BC828DRAFT_404953 [Blastocladiella britannica]|nr:hypothetical protein BC828DRAFT_404953 [Blastocladiella britannica]
MDHQQPPSTAPKPKRNRGKKPAQASSATAEPSSSAPAVVAAGPAASTTASGGSSAAARAIAPKIPAKLAAKRIFSGPSLHFSTILDILLPYAAESPSPTTMLAVLHVVPQIEVPSLVPVVLRHAYQVKGMPTPKDVARLGRLDLLLVFPRFQIEEMPETVLSGACEGGHVLVLDWMETNVRDRSARYPKHVFLDFIELASKHSRQAVVTSVRSRRSEDIMEALGLYG